MADVTFPPGRGPRGRDVDSGGDDSSQDDDRGQLFLIGALAIAVILLAVALLLNTAIYTENIATRSDSVDSAAVIEYQTAARDHTTTEFHHVNDQNVSESSPYEDLHTNYTASVDTWEATAASQRATNGQVGSLTFVNSTNGTRIVQDQTRNFTDADNNADWSLATDANARNYTMTVDRNSLNETDLGGLVSDDAFHVNFSDGDVWSVYVYQNPASNVTVTVQDSGTTVGSCEVDAATVTIDVTAATVNDQSCAPLQFFDDLGDGYDISYGNASKVNGTYSLVVDREITAGGNYHDADSGDSPYVRPVLYAVEFDLVYETPTAYYETDYRIAPGESGA